MFALVLGVLVMFVAEASALSVSAGGSMEATTGVFADSTLAMFLLGLAVGVPAGIGLFLFYLILREKQETEQDREMDELLESLAEPVSDIDRDPWVTESDSPQTMDAEATDETGDPWEKPADWWRQSGDEA